MIREPAASFATDPAGLAPVGLGVVMAALLHGLLAMALIAHGWGSGTLDLDGPMVVALTWEGPQADAGGGVAIPIAPPAEAAETQAAPSPQPITEPDPPPEQLALAEAILVPPRVQEPEPDITAEPEPEPEIAAEPEPEPAPEPEPEPVPELEPVPEPAAAPDARSATAPPAPERPAAPARPRANPADVAAASPPRQDGTEGSRALLSLPPGPGWSMADPDAGGASAPGDLQPPRLLSRTNPPYPPAARRQGREGVTTVSIELDNQGIVLDVTVLKSSGYIDLDSAALAAVRAWRFSPARQAGLPIAARLDLAVRFSLDGARQP